VLEGNHSDQPSGPVAWQPNGRSIRLPPVASVYWTDSGFGGIRNGSNAESTDLNALQRAKAAGVYKGREVPVREMKVRGLAAAIATALGIGLASVYRVLVHCA
jgi:hypothetical protein